MHCMYLLKQTESILMKTEPCARLHKEDKKLTNQGMESQYSETLPKVSKNTRNTCVACGILFKLGKLLMKYQGKAKLRDETVVVEW